jgi:CheY-like chemotaxis protein
MTQDAINLDLDFTKYFPAAVPARYPVASAPASAQVPRSVAPRAATPVNLVCFAKAPSAMGTTNPDAPVLVLDDHEGSRRLLEKAIGLYGFPVRAVADVREFAKALRRPPLPRLILLDVGLPRGNGFQILVHLRLHTQTSSIPVVMVTARSTSSDVVRGLSLGADGYLAKPITLNALRGILDTVLRRPAAGTGA